MSEVVIELDGEEVERIVVKHENRLSGAELGVNGKTNPFKVDPVGGNTIIVRLLSSPTSGLPYGDQLDQAKEDWLRDQRESDKKPVGKYVKADPETGEPVVFKKKEVKL